MWGCGGAGARSLLCKMGKGEEGLRSRVRTERATRKRVPGTPATGASQRDARPAEAAPALGNGGGRRKILSRVRTTICAEVRGGDVGRRFWDRSVW